MKKIIISAVILMIALISYSQDTSNSYYIVKIEETHDRYQTEWSSKDNNSWTNPEVELKATNYTGRVWYRLIYNYSNSPVYISNGKYKSPISYPQVRVGVICLDTGENNHADITMSIHSICDGPFKTLAEGRKALSNYKSSPAININPNINYTTPATNQRVNKKSIPFTLYTNDERNYTRKFGNSIYYMRSLSDPHFSDVTGDFTTDISGNDLHTIDPRRYPDPTK